MRLARLSDLLMAPTPRRRALRLTLVSAATTVTLVVAAAMLAVIPASNASEPPVVRVSIDHISFVPQNITIRPNTTVVWTNNETDKTTHSVTGGPLGSPDLAPGMSYSYTFSAPGDYVYHCRFHSYMEGHVTVTDEPVDTTTTTAP